jgi:hypothetical protein
VQPRDELSPAARSLGDGRGRAWAGTGAARSGAGGWERVVLWWEWGSGGGEDSQIGFVLGQSSWAFGQLELVLG